MKAFVINPENCTITEEEYNGDYRDIYRLGNFGCFDVVTLNAEGDGIYVDDEGLFNEEYNLFGFKDTEVMLAGRGVVLGCDLESGEPADVKVSLEWLQERVQFYIRSPY